MTQLSLLACQIDVPETRNSLHRDQHISSLIEKLDRHLNQKHADLVALPELASVEYSRQAFDRLSEVSETLDGLSIRAFSDLARRHKTNVVFGLPRRTDTGHAISIVAVNTVGELIGYYDKLHIAQYGASMEKEYFQRGGHLFVFEINGFKIAPIICYDIRIPELTRTLCHQHGVHLILHCGAYARDESFYSWHHFAVTRAMENQCYLASINRAGSFFGDSIVCSPWVDERTPPVVFGEREEFRYLDLDLNTLANIRSEYPFITDRLEDYGSLPVQNA